jgi:hypothetical protein
MYTNSKDSKTTFQKTIRWQLFGFQNSCSAANDTKSENYSTGHQLLPELATSV